MLPRLNDNLQIVLEFLPPRHAIFFIFCLNTNFRKYFENKTAVTEAFWQEKVKQYFPHQLTSIEKQLSTTKDAKVPFWFSQYKILDTSEYKTIALPAKKLFEMAKGGEFDEIKSVPLEYFGARDSGDKTFLDWAIITNNQKLLDSFYIIIKPYYKNKPSLLLKIDQSGLQANALYWAIKCRQKMGPIRKLLGSRIQEFLGKVCKPGSVCYSSGGTSLRPLYVAADTHQIETIDFLINEKKVDINGLSQLGSWLWGGDHTALYRAAKKGHADIVDLLLIKGADADMTSELFYCPLQIAAQNGHLAVVECLVQHQREHHPEQLQVFLDRKSLVGTSALGMAAESGHDGIVDFLIRQGASLPSEQKIFNRYSPLNLAIKNKHFTVISILIEHVSFPETLKDNAGLKEFLFDTIIDTGQLDLLKKLVVRNPWLLKLQDTVAMAIASKNKEIIEIFIEAGADISQSIIEAAATGQLELVKKIIKQCPEAHRIVNIYQETALLYAAASGHTAVVKYLYEEAGADLNVKTNFSFSNDHNQGPLHWAAKNGHKDTVAYLLEQKVNLEAMDDYKRTPLALAIYQGHDEVAGLLIGKGADIIATIHVSAQKGRLDLIKQAFEKAHDMGAELESVLERPDRFTQTPLLWAAAEGHLETVGYLLDQGASIFPESTRYFHKDHGKTALYWAWERGHHKIVAVLLKKAGTSALKAFGSKASKPEAMIKVAEAVILLADEGRFDEEILSILAKGDVTAKGLAETIINQKIKIVLEVKSDVAHPEKPKRLHPTIPGLQPIMPRLNIDNKTTGQSTVLLPMMTKNIDANSPSQMTHIDNKGHFITLEKKEHQYNNIDSFPRKGKWVIEFPKGDPSIDLMWEHVTKGTIDYNNQLIYSAKVFKQTSGHATQAIVVYTHDYNDVENIYKIFNFLNTFLQKSINGMPSSFYYQKETPPDQETNDVLYIPKTIIQAVRPYLESLEEEIYLFPREEEKLPGQVPTLNGQAPIVSSTENFRHAVIDLFNLIGNKDLPGQEDKASYIAIETANMLKKLREVKEDDTALDNKLLIIKDYAAKCDKKVSGRSKFVKYVGCVVAAAVGFAFGAIVGGLIGTALGLFSGPGAVFTGAVGFFAGGCKGAALGVSLFGASAIGVTSSVLSHKYIFFRPSNDKLNQAVNQVITSASAMLTKTTG